MRTRHTCTTVRKQVHGERSEPKKIKNTSMRHEKKHFFDHLSIKNKSLLTFPGSAGLGQFQSSPSPGKSAEPGEPEPEPEPTPLVGSHHPPTAHPPPSSILFLLLLLCCHYPGSKSRRSARCSAAAFGCSQRSLMVSVVRVYAG